ncbi:MAG: putative phosphodiesterase [Akkermansiaceae bacterium]|jgi:predicted phosphodiesterase
MLLPVLEEVDHLVLAGDVWQQRKVGTGWEEARRKYEALLTLAEERGIEVEVLRGNHDPEGGKGVTWLEGKAVLVTHGDAIYEDASPWSREIGRYRAEVNAIIEKYEGKSHLAAACADRAKEIAVTLKVIPLPKLPPPFNFFATALWPPNRMCEMIRVWGGMGKEGLRFLEESGEGARVLVCGHFHRAGIWERKGRVMMNTGSFMRGSRPWAVDLKEGKMTARALRLEGGLFLLDEVKGRWILSR